MTSPGPGQPDTPAQQPSGGSDLWRRFKTALAVGPAVLLALYLGLWPFAAVVALLGALIFWEWDRLSRRGADDTALTVGVAAVVFAPILTAADQLAVAFGLLGVAFAAMCVLRPRARNRAWMGFGMLYAAMPAISLIALRDIPDTGFLAVGWALTTVWATDIGAYGFGRTFGGPKLLPRISPKKTWSGFCGGLIAAVCWSAAFYLLFDFTWTVGVVVSALIVSLVGQGGDMFESWIKRHFGVKDSGTLFPGHGGILDRADSVVPAVTVVAVLHLLGVAFVPVGG